MLSSQMCLLMMIHRQDPATTKNNWKKWHIWLPQKNSWTAWSDTGLEKKTDKTGSSLPGNFVIWREKIKKYICRRKTIPHWREVCPAGGKFCPACTEINIFYRPVQTSSLWTNACGMLCTAHMCSPKHWSWVWWGMCEKKLSPKGGRKGGWRKKARVARPPGPGLEPGTCRVLGEGPQLHATGVV